MKDNYQKAWVVVRVGRKKNTLQTTRIYDRFYEGWDNVSCYTVFPSRKAAFAWRNRWTNANDFDCLSVKMQIS